MELMCSSAHVEKCLFQGGDAESDAACFKDGENPMGVGFDVWWIHYCLLEDWRGKKSPGNFVRVM